MIIINDIIPDVYKRQYMYSAGELETIELDFHESIYPNIIDKFGKDIHPYQVNENIYRVQVKHIINNTFYSWIIGFGGIRCV